MKKSRTYRAGSRIPTISKTIIKIEGTGDCEYGAARQNDISTYVKCVILNALNSIQFFIIYVPSQQLQQ
jgi:hypothetical protein